MAGINPLKWFSRRAEFKKAEALLIKQMEQLAPNNEWAQMVLQQLSLHGRLPSFDYNLVKFINDGYVRNPNVFSVINKIIGPAKNVPWLAYKITNKTEFKRYKSLMEQGDYFNASVKAQKAFEIVENTDLNKFIEKPNTLQDWSEYVEAALGYYLLTGNDFHYKFTPSGWKYPTQMYILPAQVTEIVPGDWRQPVKGYRMAFGASKKEIEASQVVHRKTFNPTFNWTMNANDYLYGLSPMAPLCRTVKRSNESIDASLALLLNGFPPGILSPKDAMDGNPMTDKERDKVHEGWRSQYGGGQKANLPVMSPIPLMWQALGLKSADMELLESDKASLNQIAAVYNVPLPVVNMDAATMDNMKVSEKQLWEKAIIPQMISLRDMLNGSIVKDFNKATGGQYWIDFDLQAIAVLQEDKEKLSKILYAGMEHGLYTGNEVRYKLGDDVVEGDEYLDKRMLKGGLRWVDEPQPSPSINVGNNTQDNGNEEEPDGEAEEG